MTAFLQPGSNGGQSLWCGSEGKKRSSGLRPWGEPCRRKGVEKQSGPKQEETRSHSGFRTEYWLRQCSQASINTGMGEFRRGEPDTACTGQDRDSMRK